MLYISKYINNKKINITLINIYLSIITIILKISIKEFKRGIPF